MTEEITAKGRKRARKPRSDVHFHFHGDGDGDTPLHAASRSHETELARPDTAGKAAGNPNPGNPYPNTYSADRVSAPLTAGRANPSSGDHGVGQGRNADIAVGHPDDRRADSMVGMSIMRQHQVPGKPADLIARLRTVAGDDNGDRGITYYAGEVALQSFDAASQASARYRDMQRVNHSPERPAAHTTPIGQDNGPHVPSGNVVSRPPMSAKSVSNAEAREIMRAALFGKRRDG